jgi:hypothetical protein
MSTYPYMSPARYVELYHDLAFDDPRTGAPTACEVSGYGSGWGPEAGCNRKSLGPDVATEFNQYFTPALRKLHHGNAQTPCGAQFSFRQRTLTNISADEDFFAASLTRAFNGKGSPDEITDTLRLALAVGRIGAGTDANGKAAAHARLADYCAKFITLDCNGLTGNYYGIDPNTKVPDYASAARKRTDVSRIVQADALVTVTDTNTHKHIALVEECSVVTRNADGTGIVRLKIVEWGEAGALDTHRKIVMGPKGDGRVLVTKGPKYGLGFASGDGFRYFFAPPRMATPRRWGMGSNSAG